MRAPDPAFADPRQAVLYDDLDPDRSDLDAYVALVAEVGARRVVDVGCGTGVLALLLADRGLDVVGVDPAVASLDVARAKPGADRVTWLEGDARALPALGADLAVMTGNVAQVFVDDADWSQTTLSAVHGCLRPGGTLALETRRPEARGWERWDTGPRVVGLPDGSEVTLATAVVDVRLPLVRFEGSCTLADGTVLRSGSTLRFRTRDEVEADLRAHGFEPVDVREAPDRPGLELVFVAVRRGD